MVYLGDTARAPYGTKSIPEVREYALECLDYLAESGREGPRHRLQLGVVGRAAGRPRALRRAGDRRDPAGRPARRAGEPAPDGSALICTEATATSRQLRRRAGGRARRAAVHHAVPAVRRLRRGRHHRRARAAATRPAGYLLPLREAGIDTLILGCTHYPLLAGVISYVIGDDVTLVSSAEECAKEVFATLTDLGLLHDESAHAATLRFLTTGSPELFAGIGRRLMGGFVDEVEQVYTVAG